MTSPPLLYSAPLQIDPKLEQKTYNNKKSTKDLSMSTSKVLVSACLLGEPVRYDGRDNLFDHPFLTDLIDADRVVSACPEMLGGLPSPRPYAQITQRFPIQVIASDSTDVTDEFMTGAELTVELAQKMGCVAALMKSGSPSCGNHSVEGRSFSGKVTTGAGVAAQELVHKGIPVFNEQQIDQLEAYLMQSEADLAVSG